MICDVGVVRVNKRRKCSNDSYSTRTYNVSFVFVSLTPPEHCKSVGFLVTPVTFMKVKVKLGSNREFPASLFMITVSARL